MKQTATAATVTRQAPSAVGARSALLRWWRRGSALLSARRSPFVMVSCVALLLLVSAVLHVQVIRSSTGASYDIQSYAIQAATVLRHQNVYDATTRYPYPPVWIWIVALMQLLSNATMFSFDQMVRLPATLGDLALIVALYGAAWRRWGSSLRTLLPAALFGLNPLTLLISAGHGQFDSLDLVFILLAVAPLSPPGGGRGVPGPGQAHGERRHPLWRAAALGVAIALKGYPVLFAPAVVFNAPRGRRALSALMVFVPLAASVALYTLVFGYSSQMLPHILLYLSTYDAGWGFILRGIDPVISSATLAYLSLLAKTALLFVALLAPLIVALLASSRRMAPRGGALEVTLIFAVFYATTIAMGVQYVLWILPFLCLVAPWWVVPYSAAALAAVVPFYQRLFPGALPTAPGWSTLLAPFSAHRTIGVASVIAVSALLTVALLVRQAPTAAREPEAVSAGSETAP